MEKPAANDHPIHELIRYRWSPRAFADRSVSDDTLRSLLEAARWAPSSYNDQPWYFIVAKRDHSEQFETLLGCLHEGNRTWARHAPVLMLSVARTRFEYNNEPNRHALHDVGLAAENLVIQALDEGVYVHQMAGFDPARARSTHDIPEDHQPVAAFALGYPGDPDSLPEDLRKSEYAERDRKPLEAFVFSGRWGTSSPIVLD